MFDRVTLFFEGDGRGEPMHRLLDLNEVLPEEDLVAIPEVVAFYRDPSIYVVRAGIAMGPWSRVCMGVFEVLFRQMAIPAREPSFAGYEVCQRLYRDDAGRTHWDRYARVRDRLKRLFVARLAGAKGRVTETFVMWGIPVSLSFDAHVEGDELVLTLAPFRSSPFAWPARVAYRTRKVDASGRLRTSGDFRVIGVGIRVETAFHMIPSP